MKTTFNKSNIMKNAWKIFNNSDFTFSESLKKAWENAKAFVEVQKNFNEPIKTWFGWKMVGQEVIHDSKSVAKIVVTDPTTKSGTRTVAYFTESQTCEEGTQEPKA